MLLSAGAHLEFEFSLSNSSTRGWRSWTYISINFFTLHFHVSTFYSLSLWVSIWVISIIWFLSRSTSPTLVSNIQHIFITELAYWNEKNQEKQNLVDRKREERERLEERKRGSEIRDVELRKKTYRERERAVWMIVLFIPNLRLIWKPYELRFPFMGEVKDFGS